MSISKVFYRSPHNYDLDKASDEAAIPKDGHGESLTIQSQADDANINVMLERFKVTGQMPTGVRVPEYGDFSGIGDYRSALHAVMEAQDKFMLVPPAIRARFNNDPQEFLEFCSNPSNLEELRKLGLAKETVNVDDKGSAGSAGKAAGSEAGSSGASGEGN